jgi:hypothetical protein
MLKLIPAPGAGAVTVIVPVRSAHVAGLVALAVGAAGAVGAPLIVTEVAEDVHPAAFFTVTL